EIADYFSLRNINLSASEARSIFKDTEGWVLAISLVAQEMIRSGKKYNNSFLRRGSIRSMIDSLFLSMPASYQHFFVIISLFDQWPLEVMSKITKALAPDVPPIEEQMLCLNRLSALYHYDVYLHGFRMHPLFLDYLREKQGGISRQAVKTACSINAQWCMENHLLVDAAKNYGMAADYKGLLRAVYSSPRALSRPVAASFLEILDRALRAEDRGDGDDEFLFLRHVTRAGFLLNLGRFDESRSALEKSIGEFEALPSSPFNSLVLSTCYNTLGSLTISMYRITRDISQAFSYFMRGNYYYMLNPYAVSAPGSKTNIGSYANLVGHPPREGEFEAFIEAITHCIPHASHSLGGFLGGTDSLCRAELAFFKGDLVAAEQYAREAVFVAREKAQYEVESKSLFYLLRIYVCIGNTESGRETWARIESMRDMPDYDNRYAIYDIIAGWLYAHIGAADKIASWLKNEFEEKALELSHQNYETMVRAKSLFAEKRYADVLNFLRREESLEGIGSFCLGMLEMQALQMAASLRMGDEAGARAILETAYETAAANALEMPFIELGEDMCRLANIALGSPGAAAFASPKSRAWLEAARKKASVYAKKLAAAAEQYCGDRGEEETIPVLTVQEMAILAGISKGLTRKEIADDTFLSVSTVKNIIKTIYGKLGAINRADAVRIATGMSLLT
ncbi:MAG: LuxR C-terminal-related transcriptional regulator, partial [Treponema sp.]|nr:LuxR C-terminal-related transcriptional regulator [Treponema sp.]